MAHVNTPSKVGHEALLSLFPISNNNNDTVRGNRSLTSELRSGRVWLQELVLIPPTTVTWLLLLWLFCNQPPTVIPFAQLIVESSNDHSTCPTTGTMQVLLCQDDSFFITRQFFLSQRVRKSAVKVKDLLKEVFGWQGEWRSLPFAGQAMHATTHTNACIIPAQLVCPQMKLTSVSI